MKKALIFISILLYALTGWSQNEVQTSPNIQVSNLSKDENPVRISNVKIDVKVVGALAVTTVDMTFYNPNNRVLEGELQFPLADGQSVSRFALDINGVLREGVTVEKAKGQAVFESIIRQNIDPGLLEKTQGNNFRTRVYPLPAKGTRRIVIAYEQELPRVDNGFRFFLPVEYRDKLDNFEINVVVFDDGQTPSVDRTPWGDFSFNKSGDAFVASYSAKEFQANGQLVFSLPVRNEKRAYIEKGKISGETYFYALTFPQLLNQSKELPRRVALFWDASSSMGGRNYKLDSEVLNKYFEKVKNVTVDLYSFNCVINKPRTFVINNGNWSELETTLKNTPYDGATQLGALDFSKLKVDEILLFTDGLSNFGKQIPQIGNIPVSAVNSSLKANHSMLKYISATSGGAYINLMQTEPVEAIKLLMNESFRLISTQYNRSEISELAYSGTISDPRAGFSIAGKLKAQQANITLNFGIGTKVLYSETITLKAKDSIDYDNIVERVWAAKKITELDLLYENNKDEIEYLGRIYNIVTRNTSLIVLDNVQDYVQHRITPPAELLAEYTRLVDEQDKWASKQKEDRVEYALSLLNARTIWWNRDIKKEEKERLKAEEEARGRNANRQSSSGNSIIAHQTNTYNGSTVSGVIKDEDGEALPAVMVLVKGTTNGTITDIDGNYTIAANLNDILQFSYIGMNTIEVTVRGSRLDIIMAESNQVLSEVVVSGYGTQRRSSVIAASVAVVSELGINEEIEAIEMVMADMQDISVEKLEVSKEAASNTNIAARRSEISLNAWRPDAPYMKELGHKSDKDLYTFYLSIKEEYKTTPSFFLDVANLFEERGLKEEALIILSNLAELEVENYRLTRVLAHRLKQLGYNDYAIDQFKLILTLRPEEPQTFRDLGLAYAQNKEYEEAIKSLYTIIERKWDNRFPEIEMFAVEEINNIIEKAGRDKVNLDLSSIDNRLIKKMPVEIRIVLNWDTDNSDMDLWVTDPVGEKCFYGNRNTRFGGLMTRDFTGGYGPEEFLIKEALKGKYKIQANYYGSREQTLIGPTTIYLDIYTYYSTGKEKKETITLRLSNNKEVIDIGEIVFE